MDNAILNLTLQAIAESPKDLEQKKAILQVIQNYFEGTEKGNIALIREVFHEHAELKHIKADGSLYEANLEHFINYLETHKGMPVLETHILSLDVASTIANAKVLFVFEDFIYVDFLNILRINQQWKIVDKVYLKEEKKGMV